MYVFKICPHCGKKISLLDLDLQMYFGKDEYEIHKEESARDPDTGEFPEGYKGVEKAIRRTGGYDAKIFPDRHLEADWEALDYFFHLLENSHGPGVYVKFDPKKEIPKLQRLSDNLQTLIGRWMEPKARGMFFRNRDEEIKERKRKELEDQLKQKMEDGQDWKNINKYITDEIKKEWIKVGFNFGEARILMGDRSSIGLGLKISEYKFAQWLRDTKKYNGLGDLNAFYLGGPDLDALRTEYATATGQKKTTGPTVAEEHTLFWWWRHGFLSDEEWQKVNFSNLSSISNSLNDQMNLEQAKAIIVSAKPWSPYFATPTTDWDQILENIHQQFYFSKPDLKKIDKFLEISRLYYPPTDKRKALDPLSGVNLAGISRDSFLLNTVPEDNDARKEIDDHVQMGTWTEDLGNDYKTVDTLGNGNCFFNAFSIFLAGDERLATRLRVATCVGIMSRKLTGTIALKDPDAIIREINEKLPDLSNNKGFDAWRYLDDIAYISEILKRPIRLIYRPNYKNENAPHYLNIKKDSELYKELEANGGFARVEFVNHEKDSMKISYDFNEIWTIYHVGGVHFVPLVKKGPVADYYGQAPGEKRELGRIDISFTAIQLVEHDVDNSLEIYSVGPREKIIGVLDQPSAGEYGQPEDSDPGLLKYHPVIKIIVDSVDTPVSAKEKIKNRGTKTVFVRISGAVEEYNLDTQILTFASGVTITHEAKDPLSSPPPPSELEGKIETLREEIMDRLVWLGRSTTPPVNQIHDAERLFTISAKKEASWGTGGTRGWSWRSYISLIKKDDAGTDEDNFTFVASTLIYSFAVFAIKHYIESSYLTEEEKKQALETFMIRYQTNSDRAAYTNNQTIINKVKAKIPK